MIAQGSAAAAAAMIGIALMVWAQISLVPAALAQDGGQAAAAPIENFSFSGPIQERRFHALISNMRCLENTELSLAESTAPLAGEMRQFVFRMLQDDRVDFEIRNAMVDRYGEEVLYQSAFPGHRLLIWFGPIVLLVIGLIAAFIVSMRRRQAAR